MKGKPPIPHGHVIPVLGAMQGHPESPHLWEKHIDRILRDIGLTPTIHEPCIYSGLILGERVLFMRQVDDFAISAPSQRIANHLLDLIDEKLMIPMKRQGLVTLYNGLDILQTRDYIKVYCETYTNRISVHYDGVRHALKYLHQTCSEGLYYWRTTPRSELDSVPLPIILSTEQDLLRTNRQHHDALNAHGMSDADWASCLRT
jgi:hypothetical protein